MKKILIALLAATSFAHAGDSSREINAAASASISTGQAVQIAESNAGGQATEVDIDLRKDNKLVYEVEVQQGNKEIDLVIDANSGKVLLRKEEVDNHPDRLAPISLRDAIARAEADGSKVLEAQLSHKKGHLFFKVKTLKNRTVQKFRLDGTTGEVINR